MWVSNLNSQTFPYIGLLSVADPDLGGRGGGHPDPEIRGWGAVSKKILALLASVWSKNGGGGAAPLDLSLPL